MAGVAKSSERVAREGAWRRGRLRGTVGNSEHGAECIYVANLDRWIRRDEPRGGSWGSSVSIEGEIALRALATLA